MITGVAFCPNPPALVPAVAQGAATELETLLTQCERAIGQLAATSPDHLVLVGAGPRSRVYSPPAWGSLAGFGVPVEAQLAPGRGGGDRLPLSLTVGAWLVTRVLGPASTAVGVSIGPEFSAGETPPGPFDGITGGRVGLVVMGDGTARRSIGAPGYWDERAEGFDAAVLAALAAGDAAALAALDLALAAQLLCAGAPAWVATGTLLSGTQVAAKVYYADVPFGVQYIVAGWWVDG